VHDGVEVQVEDGFLGVGEAGVDQFVVQGGEQPLLVVVGEPVGSLPGENLRDQADFLGCNLSHV